MLKPLQFVQDIVDEANKNFTDEFSKLDFINKKLNHGVFIGEAKKLQPEIREKLLKWFSLKDKEFVRRRKT